MSWTWVFQMPRINKEKGEIAIEKTPSYFVTEAAPARVYNMSDKARRVFNYFLSFISFSLVLVT